MPRCELTGKSPEVKNLVSHSNIKTKSVALPNIQQKRLYSSILGQMVNLKMASSTIRSIDHMGSFDKFILNQPSEKLSKRALSLKTKMLKKLRQKSPTAKAGGAKSATTATGGAKSKKKAE
jgi:large subunit ribosomal protein L28